MKKFLLMMSFLLFFLWGPLAETGKIMVEIKYKINGTPYTETLVRYYTKEAAAYAEGHARLNKILINKRIKGEEIRNIKAAQLMENMGRVEAVITFEDDKGISNQTYTLKEFIDPREKAFHDLMERLKRIEHDELFFGADVSNLMIDQIEEIDGGFQAVLHYDEDESSYDRTFTLKEFFDPKEKARHTLMKKIKRIEHDELLFGTEVSNLKIDQIEEMDGGFQAVIHYDEDESSYDRTFTLKEFFDPKEKARHTLMEKIKRIEHDELLFGTDISSLKIEPIKEMDGGFQAILHYDEDEGSYDRTYTLKEFFDPKAKALHEINLELQDIRNSQLIDDREISELKVGEIEIN